jgi:stalled ribosome rescue protein Dom34
MMEPGETRTISVPGKTLVINRTNRTYAEDLCDAYNEARTPEARARGLSYHVENGSVAIGFSQEWSVEHTKQMERRTERERQDFNHRQRYPISKENV